MGKKKKKFAQETTIFIIKMRLGIILVLGFAGLLLAERSGSLRGYSHFVKHRTKPREIRGFKPEFLSTAIGFGKRDSPDGPISQDKNVKIILSLLQKFPQSISLEWLLREMKNNPELAKRIATKIMAGDQDDKLSTTVDLFKPERIISLL